MTRAHTIKQLEFRINTWGGRRAGAGRKRIAPRARVPHVRRPDVQRRNPIYVTIRIRDGMPSLRQPSAWAAIVRLLCKARGRFGFHVVDYTVLRNHLHLIVECDGRESLESGMRGLNTRIARQLNKVFGRRGKLIDGRYHARELTTPLEVKNTLRYVLFNHAIHELRLGRRRPSVCIDPYSSAARFDGWRTPPTKHPNLDKDLGTSPPRTWLRKIGWKLHHGPLELDEPLDVAPPSSARAAPRPAARRDEMTNERRSLDR